MDWEAIRQRIHEWLVEATELDADRVVWAGQGNAFPERPCCSIALGPVVPVHMAEVRQAFDAGAANGEQITFTARGSVEFTVRATFFAADVVGNATSMALAEKARIALELPGAQDTLRAAGLSVAGPAGTQEIGGIAQARFESRTVLTVPLRAVSTAQEKTTWIETVTPTGTLS